MRKPWDEMTDEEKQDEVVDLNEAYKIAHDYVKFLEEMLDRLAAANVAYLETVQQFDVSQESIDDATSTLLDVVAEIVDKHTQEYEPPDPH